MNFLILDASHPLDYATWNQKLSELPMTSRDLHFEPGYVMAYAAESNARALCALHQADDKFMIYPFILKDGPPKEISCAYGYGGPLIKGPLYLNNYAEFEKWCAANGVEREFYRTHPLIHTTEVPGEKQVVIMDLTLDLEAELRKGHASSLALSRKSGVTVELSSDICLFRDMYLATMERLQANERWIFSHRLLPTLRDAYPDGFQFLLARVNGEPEAGCILLGAHATCYYHYAGSWNQHRNIGVGQATVVEAARWAKARGYAHLLLGGGTTADSKDPLFEFKAGFSKRRVWVYKYEREFIAK